MYNVFVSYRRNDVPEVAKEIADALIARIGSDSVFFDNKALRPGDMWTDEINNASSECAIMLVIIGPNWLSEPPKKLKNKIMKRNRLWDEDDYVRKEINNSIYRIETKHNLVIPVVVGNARLPDEKELPGMYSFLSRQSFHISLNKKAEDIRSLVDYIEKKLPGIAEKVRKDKKGYQIGEITGMIFFIISRLVMFGAVGYGIYWLVKTWFF